ncbi:MFS transporter [Microvirga sp. 3-52]|jgi:fucose permease|nr:MFS transporter [Microvirga sp. 3-52]
MPPSLAPTLVRDPARIREQIATRLAFFIAGFSTAAWAPLVPLAKERLGLDEGALGLLLLCLGLGSITAMPITGVLTTRIGCKAVVTSSALLILLTLPLLAVFNGWFAMAVAIAVFGAALGTLDVAMNIQAIIVERSSGKAMMSGFHGLYSVGGIAGAGLMSLLLGSGAMSPILAAGVVSAASLILLVIAMPGLLPYGEDSTEKGPSFAWPKGIVLFIGFLCFLCFLVEGAVLDWSAVFLISERGSDVGLAGLGYAAFAVAMTLGRLLGDRLRTILGEQRVLMIGGLLAAAGFLVVVLVPSVSANLLGFLLVGAGASNVVPVLFSAAGRTRAMPASLAVTAVTTLGYLGILAGPALIGFVAHLTELRVAFYLLVAAMLFIAASFRVGRS